MSLIHLNPAMTRVAAVDDKANMTHNGQASWALWGKPECRECKFAQPAKSRRGGAYPTNHLWQSHRAFARLIIPFIPGHGHGLPVFRG